MNVPGYAAFVILASCLLICLCLAEMRGLFSVETAPTTNPTAYAPRSESGCGSRGGPGFRLANGKCASWDDVR